jgi:hypothetical protein
MSVGPLGGLINSAAGSSLAQTRGSEVDRAHRDAASHQRQVASDRKAESAAGIGQTDGEDHEAAERDADGRRLWEKQGQPQSKTSPPPADHPPQSRDSTGQSGTQLDLCG